jgi:hypothetical protein
VHPSDEELQTLLDGELPEPDQRRLRLHLEDCRPCAARLRGLELEDRRIAEQLAWLDQPVPRLAPETVMATARRRTVRPDLLAAGLAALLVAAAAAAAVVPGSTLQRLIGRAITEWRSPGPRPKPPSEAAQAPRQSGVSFVPEPELEIVFLHSQPEGAIRISLEETSEVQIREIGGVSVYTLDPAELIVDNRNARASYEIVMPRGLRRCRVRIGERVVFEKDGATIGSRGSVDGRGSHLVPFATGLGGGGSTPSPHSTRRSPP